MKCQNVFCLHFFMNSCNLSKTKCLCPPNTISHIKVCQIDFLNWGFYDEQNFDKHISKTCMLIPLSDFHPRFLVFTPDIHC